MKRNDSLSRGRSASESAVKVDTVGKVSGIFLPAVVSDCMGMKGGQR